MQKWLSKISLGLLLTFAGSHLALGQDRPGLDSIVEPIVPEREIGLPDQAPPPEAAPVIQSKPTQPKAQAEPNQQAQPAPRQASASNGAWAQECLENATAPKCQAILRAMLGDQVALVVGIAKSRNEPAGRMQMALPLGLAVAKGATVKLGSFSTSLPISRCTAQGCLVEGSVPEGLIDALQKSAAGTVTIYTTEGEPIELPLPATGFSATYAAITSSK